MILFLINILIFEFLLKQKKNKTNNIVILLFLIFNIYIYAYDYKIYYFVFKFSEVILMYYFRLFFLKIYYDILMKDSYILSQLKFDINRKISINIYNKAVILIKITALLYSFPLFLIILIFDSLKNMNFVTEYDFAIKGYYFVFGNKYIYDYPIYLTPRGFKKILIYKKFLVELKYKMLPDLEFGVDYFFKDEWQNIEQCQ